MAQPTNPSQDNSLDPMWYIAIAMLLGILCVAMWMALHTPVSRFYGWVRIAQFWVFGVSRGPYSWVLGSALGGVGMLLWLNERTRWAAKWLCMTGGFFVGSYLQHRVTQGPIAGALGLLVAGGGAALIFTGRARAVAYQIALVGIALTIGGFFGGLYAGWLQYFELSDPAYVEFSTLVRSGTAANAFTLLCINIPLGIWVMRRSLATNPTNHKHYAKTQDYNLHTFTDSQAVHYPHLKLFRKLNLTKRPINAGKYRMPDTEKMFAIKHKLLDKGSKAGEYAVNRDRTAPIFKAQLGRLWRRPKDLTTSEAAVLAVLLPRIAALDSKMSSEDYKEALATTTRLINGFWSQIADSYDPATDTAKLDMSDAHQTLRKYWNHRTVKPFFQKHAYTYTVIYSMLQEARRLGVLPPAELRWLRVFDRRLWTLVDNVGRIVAFTEVAGIYHHYIHEIKRKRALEKPSVDGAVNGLVEGVSRYAFTEDEVEEIEAQLKGEAAPESVDPAAIAKQRKTIFLGSRLVAEGDIRDVVELALLGETGDVIYEQVCKARVAIELIQEQQKLDDEQLARIVDAPTSADVIKAVLEKVHGCDLVLFYVDERALLADVERSAASVRVLQDPDEPVDLAGAAVMEELTDTPPEINGAVSAARVVRDIWKKAREAEMRDKAHGANGKQQ